MGGFPWMARWLAVTALSMSLGCAHAAPAPAIAAKRTAIGAYLHELEASRQTLAGVQVNEYEVYITCTAYERVVEQIGERPAVLGLELMFAIEYPPYRAYLTDRALAQTAAGGLVTLTWHQRNPVEICPRGEYYECSRKPMSAQTLRAMLTPGTREHDLWLADVAVIADLLADWRARGIVVLFRPYHEMNGDWFWWGRKDQYPELWDALYDELAVRRGLDNLIWVWAVDRAPADAARYFPRRHAPDVVGSDVYEADTASANFTNGRRVTAALGQGAPFALTETGRIPDAATLDAMNPAWVLLWGGEFLNAEWAWNNDCRNCNTPEQVAAFFANARTVTLEETPAALRTLIAAGVAHDNPLHPADPSCPARLR